MFEHDFVYLGEEESYNQEIQTEAAHLYDKLFFAVEESGGWVYRKTTEKTNLGESYGEEELSVDSTKSPLTMFRVLVHERAHDLLDHQNNSLTESIRETQSEVIAYLVCSHYGIDIGHTSIRYIAMYGATPQLVGLMKERITRVSKKIIREIDSV